VEENLVVAEAQGVGVLTLYTLLLTQIVDALLTLPVLKVETRMLMAVMVERVLISPPK
jgi:hypothetical protein